MVVAVGAEEVGAEVGTPGVATTKGVSVFVAAVMVDVAAGIAWVVAAAVVVLFTAVVDPDWLVLTVEDGAAVLPAEISTFVAVELVTAVTALGSFTMGVGEVEVEPVAVRPEAVVVTNDEDAEVAADVPDDGAMAGVSAFVVVTTVDVAAVVAVVGAVLFTAFAEPV